MRIVLTYDVNYGHTAIKNHCMKNGFNSRLLTPEGVVPLPNTTLVGEFSSAQVTIYRFRLLANQAAPGVTIERVFAAPCDLPLVDYDRAA